MDKKLKTKYFNEFIKISKQWLYKPEAHNVLSYLLSRIDKDNIDKFDFGYFPYELSSIKQFFEEFYSNTKEDPVDVLKECGVIYITEKYNKVVSFFKYNHLLIPFYDMYGNAVSISGRTLLSQEEQKLKNVSKYKHITFQKRRHLYGLNLSYKNIIIKDFAIIVEGQFDCISGSTHGIDNIVALGGSKFSFEQIALLKRFTDNFYILLDNDEAGIEGFDKINKAASKYNINVKKIELPNQYKDLDDYLKENKLKDLRDLGI